MLVVLFWQRQIRRDSMDGSRSYSANPGQIFDGPEGIGSVGSAIVDDRPGLGRTDPAEAEHGGLRGGIGVDQIGYRTYSLSVRRWLIFEIDSRFCRLPTERNGPKE